MLRTGLWHEAPSVALTACWGLWGLAWLLGAVYNARCAPAVRERAGSVRIWAIGIVAYLLLRLAVPARVWRLPTLRSPWLAAAGIVLLVAGTAFTLWARGVLGTMWTASAVLKEGHSLRTDGPYAVTRHPIYTGMLTMLAGTALAEGLGLWIPLFALAVGVFVIKIRLEEQLLDRCLGGAYQEYRRHVPQVVPWPRPHG